VDNRELALSHARSRMVFGAMLVAAPSLASRGWIGTEDSKRPAVKVLGRALGVRDAALGLGIAVALDRGAPVRGWLEAAAVSDAVDLVATVLAGDAIPSRGRKVVGAIAAISMVTCAALARALDEPSGEHEVSVPEAHLTGHP
jgi:hypothetical protein